MKLSDAPSSRKRFAHCGLRFALHHRSDRRLEPPTHGALGGHHQGSSARLKNWRAEWRGIAESMTGGGSDGNFTAALASHSGWSGRCRRGGTQPTKASCWTASRPHRSHCQTARRVIASHLPRRRTHCSIRSRSAARWSRGQQAAMTATGIGARAPNASDVSA